MSNVAGSAFCRAELRICEPDAPERRDTVSGAFENPLDYGFTPSGKKSSLAFVPAASCGVPALHAGIVFLSGG